MKTVERIDKALLIGKVNKTDDGYVKGLACVARSGILEYFEGGKVIRELVRPETLAKADSLESLKMKPITNDHPSVKLLTPENIKQFQVGFTGETVKVDDGLLYSSISINDNKAIQAVDSGKRELSCGYTCNLDEAGGVWNGQKYDREQLDRKYNHVAICDLGRAGSVASLHMDAADVYECGEPDFKIKNDNSNILQRSRPMPVIIKVDGIDYPDQAPEVEKHIQKLDAQILSGKNEVAAIQAKLDVATAERDATKTKLDSAQAEIAGLPAKISAAATARAELVKVATPHLDAADVAKLDTLSDLQIKKSVALKAFPTAKEKIEKIDNADFITPWFDAALSIVKNDSIDAAAAENRKALNGQARNDGKECAVKTKADAEKEVTERFKKTTNRDQLLK